MSSTKRINGNYNLTNKDVFGANITISTHTLTIDGNLVVGNITSATVTNTEIEDNILTLNRGETGSGVTLGYAGIEVDRGLALTVALRWNEAGEYWELSNDGSTYGQITTSTGGSVQIESDTNPKLGGNLNITAHTLYDTDASVELQADTAAMGGTGFYTNQIGSANKKELITKNRSLVYSIIL
jgi:hypothetical protein